jgi:hypothetical protein
LLKCGWEGSEIQKAKYLLTFNIVGDAAGPHFSNTRPLAAWLNGHQNNGDRKIPDRT